MATKNGSTAPLLSLVIPFYNESSCIDCVCSELHQVLSENAGSISTWECILVDDGSQDRTGQIIEDWAARHIHFRTVHLTPNSGQSAALHAGFRAARGRYIATMDGDGQNDPRDLILLLGELQCRHVDMMCGIRERRADNLIRKASSRIANRVRRAILQDGITDVGCAIRVFRRYCLAHVPFFRNAHRFFPALVMAAGFRVAETPVRHRPRLNGTSKYGAGINNRLWCLLASPTFVSLSDFRHPEGRIAMDGHLHLVDAAPPERLWKDLLKIITVSFFFVGVALLLRSDAFRFQLVNFPLLREVFPAAGGTWRQALFFVVTFSLLIGVGMPRLWVSVLGGAAFGLLWGSLLALAASVTGAAIVYRFGRTLLAGMVRRRIGPRLALWQMRFETNAFWWVLYMRLFPLSNATLAGLLCGACRIPLGPYLAGSLLGFIPLTLVFAVFGSGGASGSCYQVALGALLLAAAVGGRKVMTHLIPPLKRLMQKVNTGA